MKLHIVDNDGVLVESINLDDYDLSNPIARAAVWDEIVSTVDGHCPDHDTGRSESR